LLFDLSGLVRLELASTFRWFFTLCLFEPVRLAVALAIPRNTDAYGYYYFITQPIVWTLYMLIILEVFRSAFAELPAIYTLSRKALTGCVAAAVVIAVLTLGIDFSRPNAPNQFLELFFLVERTVALSLVVFVLALMLLLLWFPIPLNRNALAHTVIFSFFFATKAAMLFSRNLFGPTFTRAGNVGLFSAIVVCLVLWHVFLVRNSEARIVRSGVTRDPEQEARLMEQLNAINETLAGSVRK
jgi:hypothetical protein